MCVRVCVCVCRHVCVSVLMMCASASNAPQATHTPLLVLTSSLMHHIKRQQQAAVTEGLIAGEEDGANELLDVSRRGVYVCKERRSSEPFDLVHRTTQATQSTH